MKKNSLLVFFLGILIFQSCSYGEGYKTVETDLYSIQIPSYLKEEDLAPDAEMEYANRFRNFYFVTFSADKKNTFEGFKNEAVSRISKQLDSLVIDTFSTTIHNLPAARTELYGVLDKEHVYYSHVAVNGNKKFYQSCIWVRGLDRKLKYKNTIDSILNSFTEKK